MVSKGRDLKPKNGRSAMAKGPTKDKPAFVIEAAALDAAGNFQDAVNGFNSQNWDQVRGALDENVGLYDIRHGQPVATGIDDVMAYLQSLAGATFTPLSPVHYAPPAKPNKVFGKAYWHDNDGSPDDIILYEFHFNLANSKISSLWAQSD
jgi:hypothetical protein